MTEAGEGCRFRMQLQLLGTNKRPLQLRRSMSQSRKFMRLALQTTSTFRLWMFCGPA
jgi:hypothetical protein